MRSRRAALLAIVALAACASPTRSPERGGLAGEPPEPTFSPEEAKADLAAMYRGLQSAHFDPYAYTPREALEASYRRTLAGLDRPLGRSELMVRLELFAAAVRMGHTRVDFPREAWERHLRAGGGVFPLGIRVVEGRVHVAENLSGVGAVERGDEILALDGEPMARWMERVERHVSAETTAMAHSLMEYDLPRYLWLEVGSPSSFRLTLRRAGGQPFSLAVPARSQGEMKALGATQPPRLDLEQPLRQHRLLAGNVGYLRPGPFYNAEARTGAEAWDVAGFRAFVDEAFRGFLAAGVERLVLDLRGNPGGDSLFSDVVVAWFATRPFRFCSSFQIRVSPESIAANQGRIERDAAAAGPISRRFEELYARSRAGEVVDFDLRPSPPREGERFLGRVYVLVDRQTYSNAVAVAATIQDHGFGTILGEETSDLATTYGAMEQFRLPRSGIMVGYPKARIVRPSGDVRARGVVPDVAIPIPVVLEPSDEVLQRAVEIALATPPARGGEPRARPGAHDRGP